MSGELPLAASATETKPKEAKIVLATGNAHKIAEMKEILTAVVPAFDASLVATMDDFSAPSPVEDGVTFTENALIKARHLAESTGLPALADDSGLSVDVLGGAPGVFSARWSGRHGDDRANRELLLAQLHDVPDPNRGARFVCAAALVFPDGREYVQEGVVTGTLTSSPRGDRGFGYDPVFAPEGSHRTTAELAPVEKNRISHRFRALRALAPALREVFDARGV